MPMPMPQIVILAAGSSSRMRGADKLMETIGGIPQIRRAALAGQATGCPVAVTLPTDRPARARALAGLAVTLIPVPDAAEGIAASIRAAEGTLPPGPLLLLLADLPEIAAADLAMMLAAFRETPGSILRAGSAAGKPGHPVIFPAWARADLAALSGDAGARDLLARHAGRTRLVALPGNAAVTDLDTPEDWAAWRAAGPGRSV
ncbi:NTP transferase domain-containing protein [Paracoccaceae bacterium Fryx2]|nr:NTP transferase domain-containing protein [Paracoccaceae bacterium Fryx2]